MAKLTIVRQTADAVEWWIELIEPAKVAFIVRVFGARVDADV